MPGPCAPASAATRMPTWPPWNSKRASQLCRPSFFICEPCRAQHARERGRAGDHAALRLKRTRQFGHGDVWLRLDARDQKSLVGRQLALAARTSLARRLGRSRRVHPLEELDGATLADPKVAGCLTTRMASAPVRHDARAQIKRIALTHDRPPDHGESPMTLPVNPARFHLQARCSKIDRRPGSAQEIGTVVSP